MDESCERLCTYLHDCAFWTLFALRTVYFYSDDKRIENYIQSCDDFDIRFCRTHFDVK